MLRSIGLAANRLRRESNAKPTGQAAASYASRERDAIPGRYPRPVTSAERWIPMRGALAGMRVVDLTNALAGASTTKLLGDLGADIIKVESPQTGDFTRRLVPWVFETFNRDKRSVATDLRTPDGIALVTLLA